MKKLIALVIVMLIAGVAFAADDEPIATSVTVDSEFYMNIDAATVNFGNVAQGGAAAAAKTVIATCYSNTGNSWMVKVSGPALKHTDNVATIPSNPNLNVYGFKVSGDGEVAAGLVAATPLPVVATNIYQSATNDTGLDVFKLELPAMTVPDDQKAGSYSTTITLTMTE